MKRIFIIIILASLRLSLASQLNVSFVSSSIVRVQWNSSGAEVDNATGVCVYPAQQVKVTTHKAHGKQILRSSELVVEIDDATQAVTFIDGKSGKVLLSENPVLPHEHEQIADVMTIYDDASARSEETANGRVTVKDVLRQDTVGINNFYRVNFLFDRGEALYGLGSHMEDYMNLLGKTVYLTQHNLKASVPVINSTGGFGLLFDAGCAMKFSSSESQGGDVCEGSMELMAADQLDYYFIKGDSMADVAGGYRYLTGNVSMMPRYLFGYIQSKERYVSSDDILQTLREYRRRHVPIDMIVQDWNYWPEGWGYMKMDRRHYPDPKALADSVHALDARLMVSIWPNPQYCPQQLDFKERGFMLEHSVYDVFNPDARKLYWIYAEKEFFSNGFDAWWCDSSEPLDGDWNTMPGAENGVEYGWDSHERRWRLNSAILTSALGARRSNLYSLYHSMGIYENQRASSSRKRVVNLTRSSYAGQQRYGTVVWNGDTHASWESFRRQIPAGLNYMATGNPYWTVDVGSFFTRNDGRWFYCGQFPDGVKDDAYKEYYVRMFQWATFLPVLRSHGTDTPREIWHFGEEGSAYYDAILHMINLRYSLMPYTYSMAYMQSSGAYTMARPLAFDFPGDKAVHDIKDEYMFGDILVCPVTTPAATSRKVYLPEMPDGRHWIDYWSGERHDGGQWIDAPAPLHRLPLFVVSGAIIPSAEPQEYADAQIGKTVTLTVYGTHDGYFEFYEDAGDGYGFENGEYLRVGIEWNDKERTMRLGRPEGKPYGNAESRMFVISTPYGDKTVEYKGEPIEVCLDELK